MKKEPLSIIVVKTLFVVLLFAGIGTIIFAGGWMIREHNKVSEPVKKNAVINNNEIKDKIANWQTYSNPQASFTFKYPNDWEIVEDYFYETAAGIKAKNPTIVLQKVGDGDKSSNNRIRINQRQFDCEHGKCKGMFGTYSKDPEVLDVFDKIVESFKEIEVDETAGWKTYRNEEYGFELKYPENVLTNDEYSGLQILAERINDLGDLQFMKLDKKSALEDKDAIRKGDPSIPFSWGITNSYKIVNISGALSKEFVILRAFEVCDIQFTKEVFIYKDDYRVRLIWRLGDEETKKIIKNNPSYFTLDVANCGDHKVWKDYNDFYKDLVDGKTDVISQKWINDFDQILSTFKFIEKDETADWKTYRNDKYGFEFKYPKNATLVKDEYDKFYKPADLHIFIENISEIEDMPLGYTKKNLLKHKAALEENNPGIPFGATTLNGAMENSYEIVNIPGALSKKFTTLRLLEACDVRFTREALIYKDNYLIRLRWRHNNISEIVNNNPNYFMSGCSSCLVNCENYKTWKDSDGFYKDLIAGKTDPVSQKWFNDFNQILSTFKFIEK